MLNVCTNSVIRQPSKRMAAVNNQVHVQTQLKRKLCVAPEAKQIHKNATKDDISEKNKHPSFLQNVSYCFAEYSENTSIHGLKLLTERRRPWIEKLCWFVFLVVSLYTCISLIWRIYNKWINLPVIITFATSQTSVFDIPFPAVTICPSVKSNKSLFNYTNMWMMMKTNANLTANESAQFEYMSLVCPSGSAWTHKTVIEPEVIDYLIEVAPHLENYLAEVEWQGNIMMENYTDLFSPILTSEGLCYTFNMLDRSEMFTDIVKYPPGCFTTHGKRSEWLPEKGYKLDADTEAYPRRTFAGLNGGLRASFYFFRDQVDYLCAGSVQGYKVSLHDPAEFPSMDQHYFYIPFEHSVMVAVKPNIMTTSIELDDYTPQDRNCHFSHERQLKYFKKYNQQNCATECLTNFTFAICKCVRFHMPKEEFTPICGAANKQCVKSAIKLFFAKKIYNNQKQAYLLKLTDTSFHVTNINYTENCDCLPACFSMNFDTETSLMDIKLKETFLPLSVGNAELQADRELFEKEMLYVTQLFIFFKGEQFVPSERNQLYTYTDFWANVGGIIGLFTGFSFISMFEIVYYLTVRTSCNARIFGRRYWSGAPDLLKMKAAASN